MADYDPACHSPHATGLVDIKIASPFDGVLQQLGHATDIIDIANRPFYLDVPGDRNGGPQGPPINIQFLGRIVVVSFALSSYDVDVCDVVEKLAVENTSGLIEQSMIGQFVMESRAMRLLLHTLDPDDTRNFWCAIPREPIRMGFGTKYNEKMFVFECHRPPCSSVADGILWDRQSDAFEETTIA